MPDWTRTHITAVIDESGSMGGNRRQTVEGFDKYIAEQHAKNPDTTVSIFKFSASIEKARHAEPIRLVDSLDNFYYPNGGTALLDGIGEAVTVTEAFINELPEHEQPGTVVVVVLTDGRENSSHKWSSEEIAKLVQRKEETDSWDFFFMGAGKGAILQGGNLGFKAGKSLSYTGSIENQRKVWEAATYATNTASLTRSTAASTGEEINPDLDYFGESLRQDMSK